MLKRLYILLFFAFLFWDVNSQPNLVPNGDFEKYWNCPYVEPNNTVRTYIDSILNVNNWFGIGGYSGSGAYYNRCANTQFSGNRVGIPQNGIGYQNARSGNGYTGLSFSVYGFPGYYPQNFGVFNDYIGVKLISKCVARLNFSGKYFVSPCGLANENYFYRHLFGGGDSDRFYTTSSAGMYLVNTVPALQNGRRLEFPAQINNNPLRDLNDTNNWMEISGIFEASGIESYLFLGNFNDSASTTYNNSYGYPEPWYGKKSIGSMYFIDDVSLIPQNTTHSYDTIICSNNSLGLGAVMEADSFVWFDGNKTDRLRSFTSPGLIWVKSWLYGGTIYMLDTFNMVFSELGNKLPKDTFICSGQMNLMLKSNNNNPSAKYLWSNGSSTSNVTVNKSDLINGKVWLTTSEKYCIQTDTVYIKERDAINIPASDTTTCFEEVPQILLDAGKYFKSYLWQPTGETTKTIYSSKAEIYRLTVMDSFNCTASKNILVDELCKSEVWLPNAFTPNADGTNDVYRPIIKSRNLIFYKLSIINSWGNEVFVSNEPTKAWDAQACQTGVYVVLLEYQYQGFPTQSKKNTLTLLR